MTQPILDREAKEGLAPPRRWKRFEVAWQQPILRQRLCRDLWAGFTEAEREQAITAAQGYVAWRNAQRKPPNPVNAERLPARARRLARFRLAPKPRTADPPPQRTRISIAADSAEYIALQLACHIAGIEPPKPGDPTESSPSSARSRTARPCDGDARNRS
jgi:hypothetical protein